jgi:hypothetical protein
MRLIWNTILFVLLASSPPAQGQALTGNCDNGTATEGLDISNFYFPVRNVGTIVGYDNSVLPEVPAGSSNHPIESLSFHLAGKVDGEVRAVTTNWTYELWPGPARAISDSSSTCLEYDRLWGLSSDDITIDHRLHTAVNPVTEWPVEWGAPFFDNDGTPGFQIDSEDEPLMYGDQMYWSILNDSGNRHESTNSAPLGIEIEYFAYAFRSPGTLGNSVFFRFEISNRSSDKIEDFFFGLQLDQRRAMGTDWYHGTDSTTGTIYSYFSPEVDAAFEGISQSVGLTLVDASKRPKPDYKRFSTLPDQGFSHSMINWLFIQEQYDNSADVYDWIQAKWPDLVIRRYGLKTKKLLNSMFGGMEEAMSGPWSVVQPGDSTDYVFPGDPTVAEHWSMMNHNGRGDIIFPQTNFVYGGYGPTDLDPNEAFKVTVALIWTDGHDGFDAANQIRDDARFIQGISDIITTPRNKQQPLPHPSPGLAIAAFPNPTPGDLTIRIFDPEGSQVQFEVFDALGRTVWSQVIPIGSSADLASLVPSRTWAAGVYFIRMRIGSRYYFDSFLKQ